MIRRTILLSVAALLLFGCTPKDPLAQVEQSATEALEQQAKQQQNAGQVAGANQQLNIPATPMPSPTPKPEPIKTTKATIKTAKGDIILKLDPENAPGTVQNFLQKAQSGYYDGLTFHRVEDWVVQGGDPKGTGTGGGQLPTELSQQPFTEGSLGVARGGDIKVSNDSQFFICTKDCSWLTGEYTYFGQVTSGLDIAKSLEVGDKIDSIEVATDN